MDIGILATLDFHSYKSNIDLVTHLVSGGSSTQFNLNLERQQHTIPILNPLVSAMLTGRRKIQEWSNLPAEERSTPAKIRAIILDIETVARIEGAVAALMAVGDIMLNESMREQLILSEEKGKKPKKEKKGGTVKKSRKGTNP